MLQGDWLGLGTNDLRPVVALDLVVHARAHLAEELLAAVVLQGSNIRRYTRDSAPRIHIAEVNLLPDIPAAFRQRRGSRQRQRQRRTARNNLMSISQRVRQQLGVVALNSKNK